MLENRPKLNGVFKLYQFEISFINQTFDTNSFMVKIYSVEEGDENMNCRSIYTMLVLI